MSYYGLEAQRVANNMTRNTLGSGVPVGGYPPERGLAHYLQNCDPRELEEKPICQWEAMLSAMSN